MIISSLGKRGTGLARACCGARRIRKSKDMIIREVVAIIDSEQMVIVIVRGGKCGVGRGRRWLGC